MTLSGNPLPCRGMLTIRLSRVGKKKRPTYRVIVSEKSKDTTGTFLEQLGHYDPHTVPATISFNAERVKHWLSHGAQASPTVHNLLVTAKLVEGKKIPRGKAKKSATPDAGSEAPKPAEAKAEAPAVEDKPAEAEPKA